jgi:hypothetical protein
VEVLISGISIDASVDVTDARNAPKFQTPDPLAGMRKANSRHGIDL